jgi:hypothetical protein
LEGGKGKEGKKGKRMRDRGGEKKEKLRGEGEAWSFYDYCPLSDRDEQRDIYHLILQGLIK